MALAVLYTDSICHKKFSLTYSLEEICNELFFAMASRWKHWMAGNKLFESTKKRKIRFNYLRGTNKMRHWQGHIKTLSIKSTPRTLCRRPQSLYSYLLHPLIQASLGRVSSHGVGIASQR